MKTITKLWVLIAVLIIVSPIGILAPEWLKAGGAWGEWSAAEIKGLVGYIPQELERLSEMWKAPMPDYSLEAEGDQALEAKSAVYILSGIVGVFAVALMVYAAGKILIRGNG